MEPKTDNSVILCCWQNSRRIGKEIPKRFWIRCLFLIIIILFTSTLRIKNRAIAVQLIIVNNRARNKILRVLGY